MPEPIIEGPFRRLIRERRRLLLQGDSVKAEEVVQKWREDGVPEEAIALAIKMSDRWLKAIRR